jgi:hypothetical protein
MKAVVISALLAMLQVDVSPPSSTPDRITGGTISGRILDPMGRPAAAATVTAARLKYYEGRPILVPVKTATTDDRGEYRLYSLEPGEYFLRAEKTLATGPARSYFPGAENAISATKIAVHESSEAAKTDFTLRTAAFVKVSGVVTNLVRGFQSVSLSGAGQTGRDSVLAAIQAEAAQAGRAPRFFLSSKDVSVIYDGSLAISNVLTNPQDRAAGKFELRNVRSGIYELYAVVEDRESTPARYYMAHTTIDVGLQDVSGIELTIAPGADVTGRVIYGANASRGTGPVQVQLRPKDVLPDPAIAASLLALVSEDGSFTMPNVPDLRYSIAVGPLPADTYVADIRQGNRTVFDRGTVEIPREFRDSLEIIVEGPAGSITGSVSATAQQLASDITVTLIPEEARWENVSLYKRARVNPTGSFSIAGITPGRYRLFAWEAIDEGAEQNAELIRAYWDEGTEIPVSSGNTSSARLRLILK